MIYKIFSKYDIYTFQGNEFKEVINNIEKSKAYICYSKSPEDQIIVNKRYERYLSEKKTMYIANVPKDPNSINYLILSDMPFDDKKIKELYKQYGINDDYYYSQTINFKDEHAYVKVHEINLYEQKMTNNAFEMYNAFNYIDHSYMSDYFFEVGVRRYTLIPFIAKYNDQNVLPTIIATVYSTGIITVQIIIAFEETEVDSKEIKNVSPISLSFDNIQFYKLHKNYTTKDYWLKIKPNNGTLFEIHNYYHNLLNEITDKKLDTDKNQSHYNWAVADLDYFKKKNQYSDFFTKNKRELIRLLKNSSTILTNRYSEDDIDKIFEDMKIESNQAVGIFCAKQGSLIVIGTNMLYNELKENLKDDERELTKERLYNQELINHAKESIISLLPAYWRFYELTLVKKFFAKQILNNLAKSVYNKGKQFSSIRKELNRLEVRYNDMLIFQAEGSPKEMYNKFLDKTNTNATVNAVSDILKNTFDDFSEERERKIKIRDLYTTILTSLIAVLFGFSGIKSFTEHALSKFPFGIGDFISNHLFSTTFVLWFVLFIIVVIFNWLKISSYRK